MSNKEIIQIILLFITIVGVSCGNGYCTNDYCIKADKKCISDCPGWSLNLKKMRESIKCTNKCSEEDALCYKEQKNVYECNNIGFGEW